MDPADELAELVGQIKNQIARHHAAGSWAAPGGATARTAREHDGAEHVVEEIADDPSVRVGRAAVATGADHVPLMFIGEGGELLGGPAGDLLVKMIDAMGWSRDTVHIHNIVSAGEPDLEQRIAVIGPRVIVALGRQAAHSVLGVDAPISTLRGRFHDRQGIKVMATFHPEFLLREPDKKRDAWGDLKLVMGELQRLGIQAPHKPKA